MTIDYVSTTAKESLMSKRTAAFLIIILFSALLSACGTPHQKDRPLNALRSERTARAKYDIIMIAAAKQTAPGGLSEARSVETVFAEGTARYRNEDDAVSMEWQPGPIDVMVAVRNKTAFPMQIIWDEARFIDEKGVSRRLIHSGIGYDERNLPQPPTVVAAGNLLNDFVHPADHFQWEAVRGPGSDSTQGYWDRTPFLPIRNQDGTADDLRTKAAAMVGKTFQVMLPLTIGQVRTGYLCTFRINYADVTLTEEPRGMNQGDRDGGGERPGRRRPR
jgi:hypothetical protein